ncbi:ABC transporter family substrate-binding protein [Phytoactinopolyspora halotolerans]|uniref:ABC transporter family substrate-binding protein n=1 Tax=Phytoactinopolyspora halotolerans TaxID=1981512 RepID=A0A6L9S968_9ACTN|nr:ABC transporter family substrate-binding protein [Phytoactinopolyspora halotolerans]
MAVAAASALVLAACGGDDDEEPTGDSGQAEEDQGSDSDSDSDSDSEASGDVCREDLGDLETQDDTIFYSTGESEWSGYNSDTPSTYSTYNNVINSRMSQSFWYWGTDGSFCEDTDFGTIEVLEEEPLTVQYTINDEVSWSDGTPVTAADFILEWGSESPTMVNADGEPLFDHVSGTDYGEYAPDGPQGDPTGKQFTVTFETTYADWNLLVGKMYPAHVVAEQAGMSIEELSQAILDGDTEAVEPAAEFWNTGWLSPNPGELPDPELVPVTGPYRLKEGGWEGGQYITLEAYDEYWGPAPGTQEIVFRFAAADTHVQALQNGDLNAIEPQATVDTLAQLEGLAPDITTETYPTLIWEHLDFNFMEGSPFADDLALREAFAMCVPRQQIVDSLITPIDPEAVVMNAREVFPFHDEYDEVVEAAYDGRYDQPDLEGAEAKIAESGAETPIDVRIGYSAPNPRRTDEVSLIKASCDEVGFNIIDVGSEDFFQPGGTQESGDYEVALFAWSGSGQIASGQNIYATGQPQNYGEYSNEEVDAEWQTLATSADPEVHLEQTKKIEKLLWDDLFGIPLFAHPGVVGYDSTLQNVRPMSAQDGLVWNEEQWYRAE